MEVVFGYIWGRKIFFSSRCNRNFFYKKIQLKLAYFLQNWKLFDSRRKVWIKEISLPTKNHAFGGPTHWFRLLKRILTTKMAALWKSQKFWPDDGCENFWKNNKNFIIFSFLGPKLCGFLQQRFCSLCNYLCYSTSLLFFSLWYFLGMHFYPRKSHFCNFFPCCYLYLS